MKIRILMSTYIFLVFQIEIDAANNCDERHKTKHNQCSHIIFLSLFYLGQAKGRYWHKYTTYFYVNKHTNIKIVSPFGFSLSSSFSPTYQRTSEPNAELSLLDNVLFDLSKYSFMRFCHYLQM